MTRSKGYRGVTKQSSYRWTAQITYEKRTYYLGAFKDAQTAALAFDVAVVYLYGGWKPMKMNFPMSNPPDDLCKEVISRLEK